MFLLYNEKILPESPIKILVSGQLNIINANAQNKSEKYMIVNSEELLIIIITKISPPEIKIATEIVKPSIQSIKL